MKMVGGVSPLATRPSFHTRRHGFLEPQQPMKMVGGVSQLAPLFTQGVMASWSHNNR
jgi:hypothetical protein